MFNCIYIRDSMKSNLVDDAGIKELVLNIEKSPSDSLKKISYDFDYFSIPMPDLKSSNCENIIGIDGSVKLITDRLSYLNSLTNKHQTYIINPIIFIRSVSVHSMPPFIKEDKIITVEKLEQFPIDNEDRRSSITRLESEQLQLMEINHIKSVVEEMNYKDILLLDMALHRKQYESEINEIINECKKNGINIVGWAKDSDITTLEGLSYTDATKINAAQNGIKPPWYVPHPYFKNKDIEVFLYHPPWGSFCFRTDIVPSSLSINEIFSELINCSKHSLGYPLVLYKAHQKVKITQNDANNMFRKMKKIAASEGLFIDTPGVKPFHERYLDI